MVGQMLAARETEYGRNKRGGRQPNRTGWRRQRGVGSLVVAVVPVTAWIEPSFKSERSLA